MNAVTHLSLTTPELFSWISLELQSALFEHVGAGRAFSHLD